MQRRQFLVAVTSVATTAVASTAFAPLGWAQSPPTGPVKLIVGFPAGGGTDVLARLLAQQLAAKWQVPVIVENRSGAAGVIAADYVAKQAGDGNTLLLTHINSHGIAPGLQPTLGYAVETDFVPIALLGKTPMLLIGNNDQPARTLPALVALCKSQPGKIIFGSAGSGSAQHLALETFKAQAGVDVLHVPYRGSAPLMTDLMGGHVQYAFEGMATATPLIAAQKVTPLAQTLASRSPTHPNVATVAELGYPGFESSIWFALDAPGKLPVATAERINADVNAIMATDEFKARLAQLGAEDGGGSRHRYAAFAKTERAKYAAVIKQANIKPET
ncbi:tripartite tricarboxylate transporter substrate binding protein [Alcaligenaceae bacterium C4P045]|nr:tripartite tricarboxylate transporter substrate binding protein [Alcaligenaceae bacterium C4P045]